MMYFMAAMKQLLHKCTDSSGERRSCQTLGNMLINPSLIKTFSPH